MRTRNCPWSRLVALRHWLPNGLGVLLLWLGCMSLAWASNGHPLLGHKMGIGTHLWRHSVASGGCRWTRLVWCRSIAGDRGLDAVHSGGRGSDWCRGNRARLRMGWPITCHCCLGWHLWSHLREGSTWQGSLCR